MKRLGLFLAIVACSSKDAPPPPAAPEPAHDEPKHGNPFEEFDTISPKVGDLAPDIDLKDSEGRRVKLSDAVRNGPVVLVWGSFT